MSFSAAVAADVTASTLEKFYDPKDPRKILKHLANRPMLRILEQDSQQFDAAGPAAGTTSPANFREPVQGALLRDQPGFYAGIAADDVLAFTSSNGGVQTVCPIRWMHAGWKISHEELMYQGVIISNNNRDISAPTQDEQVKLYNALQVKKEDYSESINYSRDLVLHQDGSQDAKAIAGIKSIITDDPTAGTVVGVSRANVWWRHIADTGVGGAGPKLSFSKADQSLTERLNRVVTVELPKYGGNPNRAVAGSDLIDGLIKEMRAKGMNTMTGWHDQYFDLECRGVRFGNLNIEYDPTMDIQGDSKRIYIWDSMKLVLRKQRGQWNKVTPQNQPSDQFVMLLSTTDRGVMTCSQMDALYTGVMN